MAPALARIAIGTAQVAWLAAATTMRSSTVIVQT
jgi:hypothetical protein